MYLSENLKKKYMTDFNNNVLKYEKEFWKIDNGLLKILIQINKNPYIQTLYSKKYDTKNLDSFPTSYLQICYESEIVLKIFKNKILPNFMAKYNVEDSKFICTFLPPEDNPCYEDNQERFGLACIDDKDYYRIHSIRMNLESYYGNIHNSFWEDLYNKLGAFE
jgi:hypothetical protein